jgi:hypothetical protein
VGSQGRTTAEAAGMLRYELQAMVRYALEELHHALDAGDVDLERRARADLDRAREFAVQHGLSPEPSPRLAAVLELRRPRTAPEGPATRVG